jgi:hypothetical protein
MGTAFRANTQLVKLLGKNTDGISAIFPYHHRDEDERIPYPHLTFARFNNTSETDPFQGVPEFAISMDNPRMAVCVWSKNSVDECWKVYRIVDTMLRGPGVNMSNQYFGAYRCARTTVRDDLFDEELKLYHLHSEYKVWLQLSGTPQP